jgi:endonuclease/exonuclease/phosphatase family metal-dependent hydrolase
VPTFYNLDWKQGMKRRYLQELVALLATATVVQVAATVHADCPKQFDPSVLRVITYNVQFLPDPVSSKNERPDPEYRARRIADELCHFDVAGLQEVFHAKHREQIVDRVRMGWKGELHQFASPLPKGFFTNGGCLILSHRPILESTSIVFANYSKPADYGQRADGYAAKGVLHARIARSSDEPANFIDVFVTHLEARADHLRPLQYKEMADFIRKTSDADQPFILLGDLNTYGMAEFQSDSKSQYSQLMRELQRARPDGNVIDLWPKLKPNALGGTTEQESSEIGKRIDYILLGNPRRSDVQLTPKRIEVEPYQDKRVVALSDHSAVVAELDWPRRKKVDEATR